MTKFISAWRALAGFCRQGRFGTTAMAGVVALLASVSASHYLNRGLLDQFGAASVLMVRQQVAAVECDRAVAVMLNLHRAISRLASPAVSAPEIRRQLDELDRAGVAMAAHLDGAVEIAQAPASRAALDALRALTRDVRGLSDSALEGGSLPSGLMERSFDATEVLIQFGVQLRHRDSVALLEQQASMLSLRRQTLWLMYLLCVTFSLTVAMATHWVQLGRREVRTRREADAARQAAVSAGEMAAAASRDKSKFLGMLSHELLTPLQSIVSSMDIIESKGGVEVRDPVFMRLREGARVLRARMSDLVDFAKMSAGRLAVNPRKFRIDRLVEDVIAGHEESVVRKDLDIHWEPASRLAQAVFTDPRRIRQILDNLVSNAIKYTERGGITLEVDVQADGRLLSIEVRDTGIGMAPDLVAHIFDPFYRIASSSQLAEGSGLGLAVVRSLVDLLQGRIHVDSKLGEGTRFLVEIPLAPKSVSPDEVGMPASVPTGVPPSVLIVDDAHDARAVIAEIVRGLGYQPFEAGSGGEALRVLAQQPYRAVLLDIELPDISGFDVIRQVREHEGPNRNAYFMMLSASHDHSDAAIHLFNVRAEKPIARLQLESLLRQMP